MNSVSFVTKSVSHKSPFRFSRFLKISEYPLHIPSNLKFSVRTNSVKQDVDETSMKSIHSNTESDQFGTLKVPLEKRNKFNYTLSPSSIVREKKRIIQIKKPRSNESDIFGNLSENKPIWYSDFQEESKIDNDLSDDSVLVKNFGKRYQCSEKYLSEMKRLVKEKKIKDALNLFVEMRRNFVTILKPHYTYMIGVCGKIGYTEMAFKLFRQMTDRALKPSPATLTGLFNACAESPFPEYGLQKAHNLKNKIVEKNWPLTQINYHAMIKAFGRCGDLMTAFKIVDEMAKADIKINVSTYSFLLMSCIANKEAGFTYAVEVWRKMKAKKCNPGIFACNLLLRAARDCDIGSEEISCLLLQHWSSYSKRPYGFITKKQLAKKPVLKLKSGTYNSVSEFTENVQNEYCDLGDTNEKVKKSFTSDDVPSYELQHADNKNMTVQKAHTFATSLLAARPINGPEILEIINIKTASDRLNLMGGMEGFLLSMQEAKIKPNIKTFALLLECLPDNIEVEEKLLSILHTYEIKPTIDILNILIKRRNFRRDTENAQKVLLLINKYDLMPDIMTFGALALGCRTLQKASTFINEIKKFGASPNIEIVGTLARQANMILDFPYMRYVLKLMEEEEIKPDAKLLSDLEKALSNARKNIILMEQGKEFDKFYQRKNLQVDFKDFLSFYEKWLKMMKFESEKHPWLQYETEIIDRVKKENYVLPHSC